MTIENAIKDLRDYISDTNQVDYGACDDLIYKVEDTLDEIEKGLTDIKNLID